MYGNENYDKVRDIIDARRTEARRLSEARSLEVCMRSREIKEIDEELRATGPRIFKAACAGEDIAPLKERNQELVARRRALIVKLGYPEDYTDVKYSCAKCSDTGFTPDTRMCTCFKQLLVTENIKSSGMGKLIEEQSFENFNLGAYAYDAEVYENMQAVYEAAREYAESFGKASDIKKNLLFLGKTGSGKTHISTSIAKVVIERGYEVIYDSVQNIISAFEKDKFRSGYGAYEPQGDKYLECDLLILDDLGTEFSSQFTVSCLYNLFNTRKNRALATIISTNLSADELVAKYDDRIYSRIVGKDYDIFVFNGKDFRL
ncbi:MAG: ATP-binding protein [Clostridia bacterium]|nr:ATP-binding protein [Clostridia bacterium]